MADVREDVPKEVIPLLNHEGWIGDSPVRRGEGQHIHSEQ